MLTQVNNTWGRDEVCYVLLVVFFCWLLSLVASSPGAAPARVLFASKLANAPPELLYRHAPSKQRALFRGVRAPSMARAPASSTTGRCDARHRSVSSWGSAARSLVLPFAMWMVIESLSTSATSTHTSRTE